MTRQKGRNVPPMIFIAHDDDSDPSMAVDNEFFARNPSIKHYERAYIPGETPQGMPPATRVAVWLRGTTRVRAFATDDTETN